MAGQYDWSGNLQHVPHFSTGKVEEWSDSAGNIPRRKQDKGYQKFLDGFVHNIEGNWRFSFLFVNPRLRSNSVTDYIKQMYRHIQVYMVYISPCEKFSFNFSLCGHMRD